MSVGATPSLNFIGDTVGDVAPHAMSEMRGINFATGNSPTTGAISLSNFRNQVLTKKWVQKQKIQASPNTNSEAKFGAATSMTDDGNTIIVGQPEDRYINDIFLGAAYIFTRSGTTWTQQAKLVSSPRVIRSYLGSSVSITPDGNTAAVGAYREDAGGSNSIGAAYIFTRSGTTWTQQARIVSSDRNVYDFFGSSISISDDGNTVAVGATGDDDFTGSAYIFTRSGTTWTQQAKIRSSDIQAGDIFGAVSISGDGNTLVVGALREDTGGTDAGSAYIFTRSGTTWSQQAKIQSSDRQAGDDFGANPAISSDGNTVIFGAPREDTGGFANLGAAYIFTRSGTTWTQQAKIQASDKQNYDKFGSYTDISNDGNIAIISGVSDSSIGNGKAYIFTRSGTTWTQKAKLEALDPEDRDYFGGGVSISGDGTTAAVGAPEEDTGATNAGSAYIFKNDYYI